jgi:7-cyano-7-deazaguanine tRNA-ribosyltransferase
MARPDIKRAKEQLFSRYIKPHTKTEVCLPEPGDRTDSFEEYYRSELSSIWNTADAHIVYQTIFGPVPIELECSYPFGQSVVAPKMAKELSENKDTLRLMEKYSHGLRSEFSIVWSGEETIENLQSLASAKNTFDLDSERIRAIANYQFGLGAGDILLKGKLEYVKSKNTGKIRNIISNGEHVLSLRAGDGFFTLKFPGAIRLHSSWKKPKLRVIVEDDSAEFNRTGKNVFAKFVISCDPDLRPGDEVLIVDNEDNLVAIGRMILNWYEMQAFDTGIAVRVREGCDEFEKCSKIIK